ncbi:hypothetical protein ACWEJZ_02045 [Streptomyces bacillaris]|uniref:hypothetical protein n=1 Tax=Streptomyces sp. S8 TaxID=1837283 RepID=UPI000A091A59|nr:hypothetical protein [Streptomyces sp. S8]ARI52210.1 hypothetical protein A6E92_08480 [Streptomyces sp. S8]
MTTCAECGDDFDVSDAREEYRAEWGAAGEEGEYDELYEGGLCGSCALSQTESNLNLGRALMMVNGDEDYDQEHVDRYL